jgi:hypothetical protein
MYVSYGLRVGISIAIYLILLLISLAKGMIQNFIIITVGLILLMPYVNALSKVIWAGFFFKFHPKYDQD